jgi:hypothetical protein
VPPAAVEAQRAGMEGGMAEAARVAGGMVVVRVAVAKAVVGTGVEKVEVVMAEEMAGVVPAAS